MVDIREKPLVGHADIVIVRDSGLWLIGMANLNDEDQRILSPVFELSVGIEQGPRGGQVIRYGAVPCLLLEDITRYELGPDAHVWPIKAMSVEEHLRHAYQSGLEASAGLKASRGRITIAMPGDVPPIVRPNGAR